MASSYTTEPPPTASVLLHTTAGPLTISLFAGQTPLTCRNFLQHCIDGAYSNNIFHRVAPGFVIQTGDQTGTGEGGENIYDAGDGEFETYDESWARTTGREKGERIKFGDEIHSRLKFNRRGLVGMAKTEGSSRGGYGSQFFITLGDARAELDGRCTMFGRVEGEGIYNVVKIAEGELVEGTERPAYPEKIQHVEILEMPKGEAWESMRKRERTAKRVLEETVREEKPKKKKAGKALLSFGGDEGDSEDVGVAVRPKKAKFNTALIDGSNIQDQKLNTNGAESKKPTRRKELSPPPSIPQKRKASSPIPSTSHHRTPSFHDSTTQLPLRNEESPSKSPTSIPDSPPRRQSTSKSKSALESEITSLKESMRRHTATTNNNTSHRKSALESLIPATSSRGRKRPKPGDSLKDDKNALKMLNAFRARLESAKTPDDATEAVSETTKGKDKDKEQRPTSPNPRINGASNPDDEEAQLCDLHFIVNCQSCSDWPDSNPSHHTNNDNDNGQEFLQHSLTFARDRLGKDLEWKKNMRNFKEEDMGELGVIDVKGKEREVIEREREKKRRERERRR